ncbi:MAG: hypothetical protein AAFQ80_08580 [Cyanobacteria bacterium J06621_8]
MKPNIQIDLSTDAYEIANKELKEIGYYFNKNPLVTKDLSQILTTYFDVISKLPPQINWEIKKSSCFERSARESLSDSDIKKGLTKKIVRKGIEQLIHKAKSGQNLKYRLSPHLIKNFLEQDTLLNDWGIFHFHLGLDKENDKFVTNYDRVVYAYLNNGVMYLIKVGSHKDFSDQNLIAIIENNWTELLDPFTLRRIKSIEYGKDHKGNIINAPTDEDIKKYRKSGAIYILKTQKGRFVGSLGGGYTITGNRLSSVRQSKHIIINIREIETFITQKPAYIKQLLQLKHDSEWHNCNFKLTSFYPQIIVKEVNQGKIVRKRF